MNISRRRLLSVTAAGLIHVVANSKSLVAKPTFDGDLLVRQAAQRGHTDLGWLKSYHTFSFGRYYDQRHMGFRSLRVINDDRIAASRGFPTHPHRDMEIISYVLDGSLQHKDSTGKGAIITPDDIQMMSAGQGITHSEYNPSRKNENHFLQIWIDPAIRGALPRYSEEKVTADQKTNQWKKIVGPEGSGASVKVRQDATILQPNWRPTKCSTLHSKKIDMHGFKWHGDHSPSMARSFTQPTRWQQAVPLDYIFRLTRRPMRCFLNSAKSQRMS